MSEDTSQEKTHEASEKRKREAKKKGQIPRSKEFNIMILLFGAGICLLIFGNYMAKVLLDVFEYGFSITSSEFKDLEMISKRLTAFSYSFIKVVSPILLVLFILAIGAPTLIGGWSFNLESIGFKFERLDPIKGLKKIFSVKSLVELVKSILKFIFISVVFYLVAKKFLPDVLSLSNQEIIISSKIAMYKIDYMLIMLCFAMFLISMLDVPFQIWNHNKELKMTTQELKDEYKDTEGKPEVKSKIRQLQRQFAKRRMISNIPEADVIITNPTHYAVALKYNQSGSNAPVVVAKGVDLIAQMIRKVATAHDIPFVEAPPLARSLYYNVELDNEIPQGLYVAVAKVLAYVFELKKFKQRIGRKPNVPKDLVIPDDLAR